MLYFYSGEVGGQVGQAKRIFFYGVQKILTQRYEDQPIGSQVSFKVC